jgi:hypothetical protein
MRIVSNLNNFRPHLVIPPQPNRPKKSCIFYRIFFDNQAELIHHFVLLLQAFVLYAGLDNELFYLDKTMMVFGDAKKVVEDMVKAVD